MTTEIDVQVIEALLGGFCDDPDTYTETNAVQYYLHPRDGVLRSEPHEVPTLGRDWPKPKYGHQWTRFRPSSDEGHAFVVVRAMRGRGYIFQSQYRLEGEFPFSAVFYHAKTWDPVFSHGYDCADDVPARAISYAAIMALRKESARVPDPPTSPDS